jgi:aryl-alcohol dehydrogenase-like predicted oxidoreductase
VELSIIAFPGLLLNRIADQDKCNRVVAQTFEMGCNYYDVAPAYGKAQERLGPALAPYRSKVFLACKTQGRDAERCKAEMEKSLELLKTDHFDLYQLHVLRYADKDVDVAFGKGGAMETILQAKKDGKIRYIGFSAHTMEAALAAMNRFDFDSVMFPLNFASIYKGEFGAPILELAKQKNTSRIAIKAMVKQEWPKGADKGKWKHMWYEPLEGKDAELAVRWSLSKEITAAIPPADETCLWAMMEIGRNFKPITADEDKQLVAMAQGLTPLFRKGKITG